MDRERQLVPSAWAIYLALAVVVALAAGNVVINFVIDSKIEALSGDTADNALRSVTLIDDLRGQAQRLAAPASADELAEIEDRIDRDARSYEPIATYIGEREEWQRLQNLLDRLRHPDDARPELLRQIDASIDRLAVINQEEAAHNMDEIRRSQAHSFGLDIFSALIVLGVSVLVMVVVSRLIRSRRKLIEDQFELTLARQRDLEAFAGRVAHDLRHPLTPLRLSAGMLATNPTDKQKVVDRIVRNVDDMAAIIDSLLALSMSGQPEPGTTKVAPVISEVVEQSEAVLRGGRLSVSVADCTVACSSTVLRQIVMNLVTNAGKYRAPERDLEVTITVVTKEDVAELTVADNGIGMDEATAAHVFEPLYRGATARSIPGHGLGLAIVGRTVSSLHGTYSVTSKRGEGSQFVVRLPLAVERIAQPGPSVADVAAT